MPPADDHDLWPLTPKTNQFIFVPTCTTDKFDENLSMYTIDIMETASRMDKHMDVCTIEHNACSTTVMWRHEDCSEIPEAWQQHCVTASNGGGATVLVAMTATSRFCPEACSISHHRGTASRAHEKIPDNVQNSRYCMLLLLLLLLLLVLFNQISYLELLKVSSVSKSKL